MEYPEFYQKLIISYQAGDSIILPAINRAAHKMAMPINDIGDMYEFSMEVYNNKKKYPELVKMINDEAI
jgi:hypothetical protein